MTASTKPNLEEIHLETGGHPSREDGVCIMELAAWMAGREHSDHPPCVSPSIGQFLRTWNDRLPDEPRQLLKPYALKVLHTATTQDDEKTRRWMATDWLVRTFTPTWLDKAGLTEHAQLLRDLPELTSSKLLDEARPIINEARKAANEKWRAAGAAGAAYAADAFGAAKRAADEVKANGGDWYAQYYAARDAARPFFEKVFDAEDGPFAETVTELRASAFELLDRMIEVGKAA